MNTERLNVLVVGGAGYVGSHACKALHLAGYRPVVYDDLSNGHAEAVKWGPLLRASLGDRDALRSAFQAHDIAAVLHFAAFIEAGQSVISPLSFYQNNVQGTLNLLAAMAEAHVRRLVFSSTAAVYGEPQTESLVESHPWKPINPYGRSKLMVEDVLRDCAAVDQIDFTALRYFNAAGADPDGELGEDHQPETHLIPLVLQAAAGLRPQISVYGTDYETRDGTCERDYVHVSDLAHAHVLALGRLLGGQGSLVANLGNGRGFTVREIISTARAVTGCPIEVQEAPRRTGDPARLVADATLAQAVLGWTPRYSQPEVQIAHAWRWMCASLQNAKRIA